MKWKEVVKAKTSGGLGLGCSSLKNKALLAKWWWRFGEETKGFMENDKGGWAPKSIPRYRRAG